MAKAGGSSSRGHHSDRRLASEGVQAPGGKISAEDTELERKNTCNKGKTTRDLPTGRFMVTVGAEDPEVKEKQRHLFGIPQPQPGGARSQF